MARSLSTSINLQVYLSRARRMWGTTKIFDTLFEKTERCYPTERSRYDRGFALNFALTNTMEMLLGNDSQAKVMPAVYLFLWTSLITCKSQIMPSHLW